MTAVKPPNPKYARPPNAKMRAFVIAPKADPISALAPGDAKLTLARIKQYFKSKMQEAKK